MKQNSTALSRLVRLCLVFCTITLSSNFISCTKTGPLPFFENNAARYNSDVIDKWITMQLRLMRDATGIPNVAFSRYYAYSGVAAFESLAPGTLFGRFAHQSWNGLSGLPVFEGSKKYFWPASVNTSLASMNRNIFINASADDKAAIDSLENALNAAFAAEDADVVARSNAFGKAVADAVFTWSETDGYKHASDPYTPPVGAGLWVP